MAPPARQHLYRNFLFAILAGAGRLVAVALPPAGTCAAVAQVNLCVSCARWKRYWALPSTLEIEVKLTGNAKALAKAWDSEPLQGDPASEEVTKSLENVYFDTENLRLRQLGYALRIRKDGARLVQTLKSKDVVGKGIARRREWSSVVRRLEPDIKKIGDESVRDEIGVLAQGELQPIFTTKVQRRQRLVKCADEAGQISVIEVAFDQGEILAAGQKEPIGEIEFELQRGQTAAIHGLIGDVLATANLTIETRSKSARGYALSTGRPPTWQKATAVTLSLIHISEPTRQ